jgi:hypothetical protein
MRTLQIVGLTALALAAAGVYTGAIRTATVRAQTGCTVSNLQGNYAYNTSGTYGMPQGLGFFAAVGRLTFNGDGTFAGLDTASNNGQVQRNRATSGMYTVGADCRGTLNYTAPSQSFGDFIISSGGQTLSVIQADASTVISGSATLQVLPANP